MLPGATFGSFSAGSKTTPPCTYPWTELHQTRFQWLLHAIPQESSVGYGKMPVLADWPGFGAFLALFRTARRRRCPGLTARPNCTKLEFLGLCRPFHRNQAFETGKYQYYQIALVSLPGATFGSFSAGSKTTLSCTYPWTKLHQTRFLVFLHAIPQESSVGNGKLPVLADWPGFGALLALFRPARRRRCPGLTLGPNCTKLGSNGFCTPFHRNLALETRKYQY